MKLLYTILCSYIGLRHIIPKEELTYGSSYKVNLLAIQRQNFLLFDRVTVWYDTDFSCFPTSEYYWKRIKSIKININKKNEKI